MAKATKAQAVALLRNIGALLEYRGENSFKVRAYETAARALAAAPADLEELLEPRQLERIPGIGKATADAVREFAKTGSSSYHDELAASAPSGIAGLLRVPGLGIKRIRTLHEKLGLDTVEQLEEICNQGTLKSIPGCTQKTAEKILEGIQKSRRFSGRILLSHALAISTPLLASLQSRKAVSQAEIVGSLRRRCETVGDINLLVSSEKPEAVLGSLNSLAGVMNVVSVTDNTAVLALDRGLQADVRIVREEEFTASLIYYTGNREHVQDLQRRAEKRGMNLTEGSIFKTGKRMKVMGESDIYAALGLAYIEPELREGLGETSVARRNRLPELITLKDYRGVLHCHTTWSDGSTSIQDMARAARSEWGSVFRSL